MEKEFIPYEQTLVLKELGFNEKCFGGYLKDNKELWIGYVESQGGEQFNRDYHIPAPLYQQAFRWFREKYELNFFINIKKITPFIAQISLFIKKREHLIQTIKFEKKYLKNEEFCNIYKGIELEYLKKLIEIVKNK